MPLLQVTRHESISPPSVARVEFEPSRTVIRIRDRRQEFSRRTLSSHAFIWRRGMSVLRLANEAVRRSISLICIGLLATGSFAQNAPSQAPPATVATPTSAPEPVPPMPQAPAPQHNAEAHPYSINDYTRGQSSFPRIWQPYVGRHVSPSN